MELLCGILFWGVVVLAWITYLIQGKPAKPVRYVGTGLLVAVVSAVGLLVFRGLYIEEKEGAFFSAACQGDTAQVERLIKSGADINYEEENLHMTPLMCAAVDGHADTVKVLLRYHPDLNRKGGRGITATQMAIESSHPDVVRLLEAAEKR
ncbi:MAG: ank1B3 [Chthonomonadaceae bacterium]|nr:ank1B3 [Chthonomonadaceae bacterium]